MLRKIFANTLARKLAVFSGVLAISFAAMSGAIANQYGDEQLTHIMQAEAVALTEAPAKPSGPVGPVVAFGLAPLLDDEWVLPEYTAPHPDDIEAQEAVMVETLEASPPRNNNRGDDIGFVYSDAIPLSRELQEHTYQECQQFELDYKTVLALMWRESRFQVSAVHINRNGTQDSGIMQINDVNKGWLLEELGITDLMDPMQNITAGITLFGRLAQKYGEHYALMAYQFGEQGMLNQIDKGVTTTRQIQDVYDKRAQFAELLSA
jgi:soluble lytic murein transglycosylase-like protein